MSHSEFRTPLNAIMGLFRTLSRASFMGEQVAPVYMGYADHIHRSGEHLLNIVNDILDMAKIESGAQPVLHDAMDISAVIVRSLSFVEQMAHQSKVALKSDIAQTLPRVSGDERFVRQVLINLLSNAIKFSAPGDMVRVQVSDRRERSARYRRHGFRPGHRAGNSCAYRRAVPAR